MVLPPPSIVGGTSKMRPRWGARLVLPECAFCARRRQVSFVEPLSVALLFFADWSYLSLSSVSGRLDRDSGRFFPSFFRGSG